MKQHVVVKGVTLLTKNGNKPLRKDTVITAQDVGGQKNIDRLLAKGYIKLLVAAVKDKDEGGNDHPPFYMIAEEYLTPEQVEGLKKKAELIEYAAHIEVTDFNPKASVPDMQKRINDFIAEEEGEGGNGQQTQETLP